MNAKPKCQGKRRQFRGNAYGVFKCTKNAVATVETHVGFTEHRYVCDHEECYSSIACGYPATFTPFKKA
jgi:hypothetical protein